jgi:5-methylcytosine-specific restriction endonuclease McrA
MVNTKICTKCGKEQPLSSFCKDKHKKDGLCPACKDCHKQYRLDNKGAIHLRHKQYCLDNKEVIRVHKKQYRLDNKERFLRYYTDNRDIMLFCKKQYYIDNRDVILLRMKRYRQTEQGKAAGKRGNCKRRDDKAMIFHEKGFDPKKVFERDEWICQLCGVLTSQDYEDSAHPQYTNLDHIYPISKGGSTTYANTQCLCRQCNLEKGSKVVI